MKWNIIESEKGTKKGESESGRGVQERIMSEEGRVREIIVKESMGDRGKGNGEKGRK